MLNQIFYIFIIYLTSSIHCHHSLITRLLKIPEDSLTTSTKVTRYKGRYQINLHLNNNNQNIQALISLQTPFTYFLPDDYNINTTNNMIDDPSMTPIDNILYYTTKHIDNLELHKVKHIFNDYSFYVLSSSNQQLPKYSTVSFALNQHNMTNSLVHVLHRAGIINKPSFTLHHLSLLDGKMSFGLVHLRQRGQPGVCKANTELVGWNCPMRAIINRNNTNLQYIFQSYALFEVSKNKTTTPCEFVYYIKENVIKNYFDDGSCFLVEYKNKIRIECDKFEKVVKFPHLQFDFYNFGFNMPLRYLFVCYLNKNCYSLFKCRKNVNDFIFGGAFIKETTLQFDYVDKTVTFINEGFVNDVIEIYEHNGGNNNNHLQTNTITGGVNYNIHSQYKHISIFICLSLSIMTIILIIIKLKRIQ